MREAGGFRMGPFELMDLIGHDVNFAVTRSVYDAFFQDPRFTPSLLQQELVAAGFLGRKSGRGFYRYGEDVERPAAGHVTAGPAAAAGVAEGELGPLEALCRRWRGRHRRPPRTARRRRIRRRRAALALTDGRTATERMAGEGGLPLVLVDLALDYRERRPRGAGRRRPGRRRTILRAPPGCSRPWARASRGWTTCPGCS